MKTLSFIAAPRDYQNDFVGDMVQQLDAAEGNDKPPALLYASPTGTGKSLMALLAMQWLPDAMLVTPRLEIVAGMLQKGGIDTSGWNTERLAREALEYRITTPIRARNMLAKGELPWRPDAVIWDECHHRSADSYQDIRAYLGPVAEIGLTASPFRGTPQGTKEFLDSWDSLTWVLTYPEAAQKGYIAVPRCEIWPLSDDDEVEVTNGEITVRGAEEIVRPRLADVVDRCRGYRRVVPRDGTYGNGAECWDRPTIFAVPSTDIARELAEMLNNEGLPAAAVTQDTPRSERNAIFAACEAGNVAIVQIDVVSEGVDLKLRRLIDLRPTLSPVKWIQQVGRVGRPAPDGRASEYICTNRNLERFAYLYDGLIPPATVATAQQAFERPSRRAGARVVGGENLGRFQAAELPLADGTVGLMYNLTTVEGFKKKEYAILLHPCNSQPLYAARENQGGADGAVSYGKWQLVDALPDFRGFGSAPAKTLSDRQRAWWERAAKSKGLDPNGAVNRRNFAALPILTDLGIKLGC